MSNATIIPPEGVEVSYPLRGDHARRLRKLPQVLRYPPATVGDTVVLYDGRTEKVERLLATVTFAGELSEWRLFFPDGRSTLWRNVKEVRGADGWTWIRNRSK